MKVAVFEDIDEKWTALQRCLIDKGILESNILRITHVAQFLEVVKKTIDLCIIDLRMPGVAGGETRNVGTEILSMLDYSGNKRVPVLAITAFPGEVSDQASKFQARGCIVFDYDKPDIWKQALDIYIAQARERGRYDYIIFTAIPKEREAFNEIFSNRMKGFVQNNLDIMEFQHEGKSGAIILLPRMGLVNATAVVARALELYTPDVVAMSGICAGIGTSINLGQLLITDVVWEYQSGKWLAESFEAEPYQVSVPARTRSVLTDLISKEGLITDLESHYRGERRPELRSVPKLAVFTTGSAVIASKKRLKHVKKQHRKVSGLDMEVFGLHRAVELSGLGIHVFSAKTVVDLGDEAKGDDLHKYGCVISAAFVLKVLSSL